MQMKQISHKLGIQPDSYLVAASDNSPETEIDEVSFYRELSKACSLAAAEDAVATYHRTQKQKALNAEFD